MLNYKEDRFTLTASNFSPNNYLDKLERYLKINNNSFPIDVKKKNAILSILVRSTVNYFHKT